MGLLSRAWAGLGYLLGCLDIGKANGDSRAGFWGVGCGGWLAAAVVAAVVAAVGTGRSAGTQDRKNQESM